MEPTISTYKRIMDIVYQCQYVGIRRIDFDVTSAYCLGEGICLPMLPLIITAVKRLEKARVAVLYTPEITDPA